MKTLYLYLADEYLGELAVDHVRGRETYMFRYDPACLRTDRPMLDPAIRNVTGPQYPLTNGIFGFLADVAPDRWGRKLIRRREKRVLMESDFVLGVCDLTRQGALRIKKEKDGPFVASDLGDAAPPWTTLLYKRVGIPALGMCTQEFRVRRDCTCRALSTLADGLVVSNAYGYYCKGMDIGRVEVVVTADPRIKIIDKHNRED